MDMNAVEMIGLTRGLAWLPWAVSYFFLIGISCMAFFLALPGFVFEVNGWQKVSGYALLAALVFGLAAPVALLADLHQPGRFMNFYLHPHLNSWMAWGAFFIPFYLICLLCFSWLCLRPLFLSLSLQDEKFARIYNFLACGGHKNRLVIRIVALLAAFGALLVLVYTGMELVAVSARPFWGTPLLPVLLATTAFPGALAITLLFSVFDRQEESVQLLNRWQQYGLMLNFVLLAYWILGGWYGLPGAIEGMQEILQASASLKSQLIALLIIVFIALTLALVRKNDVWLISVLALLSAWLMRWSIFIGGQSIPKMGAGSYQYTLTMSPESMLGIAGMLGLCTAFYIALTTMVPWNDLGKH